MTRSTREVGLRTRTAATAVLLAMTIGACATANQSVPYIDLSRREVVPNATAEDAVPLRMAVAAVLSPEGNIENYAGLALYLAEHLSRPVELVQRRTYAEVNDLIADGAVDLAFVCTSAYVVGSRQGDMELLVVPVVDAESVYYSSIIVPIDSPAETIADLEGATFAFTDPMSLTGRVYPTHLVRELDNTPDTFFSSTFFTYSHDRAIEAVADGVAHGAAVDSLVLDHAMRLDPSLRDRLKVIHLSPPFGIPPVVVPSGAPHELRDQLVQALLDLPNDAAGRSILNEIGVDRFMIGDDTAYEDARALVETTGVDS